MPRRRRDDDDDLLPMIFGAAPFLDGALGDEDDDSGDHRW